MYCISGYTPLRLSANVHVCLRMLVCTCVHTLHAAVSAVYQVRAGPLDPPMTSDLHMLSRALRGRLLFQE